MCARTPHAPRACTGCALTPTLPPCRGSARPQVEKVAERLLEKEVLKHEDMVALVGPRPFPNESTVDLSLFGAGEAGKPVNAPKTAPPPPPPPAPATPPPGAA